MLNRVEKLLKTCRMGSLPYVVKPLVLDTNTTVSQKFMGIDKEEMAMIKCQVSPSHMTLIQSLNSQSATDIPHMESGSCYSPSTVGSTKKQAELQVVVTESKINKVPLEQKGRNAVQQPIQTGTKCGLVQFWKFMFNAMLMKSILMFDFKNDHDLIGIHLSLDVCSRWQRSNKDFDYDLGKVDAYGKLELMNALNVQHSNDWGWTKHNKSLWRRILVWQTHAWNIYEKGDFCIWNTKFLDWILSMWNVNFESLISWILDELGDVFFVGSQVNCEGPQWRARPICRWDSTMHPKSVHFTQFYITKHMEEHHHWEYWGIEADSRLSPTIRSILVAPTRPLQFIQRNFVKNWQSNAHYKFLVIPAMSLIYLSLSILHQIGHGNLCWSCMN